MNWILLVGCLLVTFFGVDFVFEPSINNGIGLIWILLCAYLIRRQLLSRRKKVVLNHKTAAKVFQSHQEQIAIIYKALQIFLRPDALIRLVLDYEPGKVYPFSAHITFMLPEMVLNVHYVSEQDQWIVLSHNFGTFFLSVYDQDLNPLHRVSLVDRMQSLPRVIGQTEGITWIQNTEAVYGYCIPPTNKKNTSISCRTRFLQGCQEYKELEEQSQRVRSANDALTHGLSFDDKNTMKIGGAKDTQLLVLVPGFGPRRTSISVSRLPGEFPAVGFWSDKSFPSSPLLLAQMW